MQGYSHFMNIVLVHHWALNEFRVDELWKGGCTKI